MARRGSGGGNTWSDFASAIHRGDMKAVSRIGQGIKATPKAKTTRNISPARAAFAEKLRTAMSNRNAGIKGGNTLAGGKLAGIIAKGAAPKGGGRARDGNGRFKGGK